VLGKREDGRYRGPMSKAKDAAHYWTQTLQAEFAGRVYRFIVVRSSKLDNRKEKKLERVLETEQKDLAKLKKHVYHQGCRCSGHQSGGPGCSWLLSSRRLCRPILLLYSSTGSPSKMIWPCGIRFTMWEAAKAEESWHHFRPADRRLLAG
jgi:hypothetical protein